MVQLGCTCETEDIPIPVRCLQLCATNEQDAYAWVRRNWVWHRVQKLFRGSLITRTATSRYMSMQQVAQGIVWVWGENGPDAALESLLSKPALVSALEDKEGIKSGRVVPGALVQRDLAYSWDTFMENIMVRAGFLPRAQVGCCCCILPRGNDNGETFLLFLLPQKLDVASDYVEQKCQQLKPIVLTQHADSKESTQSKNI